MANLHHAGTACNCLVKDEFNEEVLDVLDPHKFCQECFYCYPYPLQRALKPKLEGTVHDPNYKMRQLMKFADYVPSSGDESDLDEVPPSSETETMWKEALLQKKMPLLKLEPNRDRPFPSLLYLSKLRMWETFRPYMDFEDKVQQLPISEPLKKDLITFIEEEEVSLQKHICLKFKQLLFCEEFLNSM